MKEISIHLRAGLGDKAKKAPMREFPNWAFRLVGLIDKAAKDIVSELGRDYSMDNSETRKALKMDRFISAEEAVVAAGRSLLDNNSI